MKQRISKFTLAVLLTIAGCTTAWAEDEPTYNVVYVSKSGSGSKTGADKNNPIAGFKNAYAKLSKTGGTYEDDWNKNIIVVVGEMDLKIAEDDTNDGVPATITGIWPWEKDKYTESEITNGGKVVISQTNTTGAGWRIGSDTRFKNLTIKANGQGRLSLMMHNTLFDTGLVMTNWGDLATENGLISGRKAPDLHVIIMEDMRATDTSPYELTKPVNVTIRSGRFGRILSVRTTGTDDANVKKKYRIGSPNYPLLAKVTVDIEPDNFGTSYSDDIAYLCAGSTQGAVYGDFEYDIIKGKIGTFVAGTQGNAIKICTEKVSNSGPSNIPSSMFAGRATININPANDADVVIQRYYGANQGRVTAGVTKCQASAYFYGQSVLNMNGGTIENGIYVSSAGVSGLRSPDGQYHTWDPLIPYVNAQNEPQYASYDAGKTMATVKSRLKSDTPEDIPLTETQAIINISGGIVKNGIYGGSYGYSEEFAAAVSSSQTPKYQFMPKGAGSFFGNTSVNIFGGNISGGVYGGGKGSTDFYNKWDSNCADQTRDDFLSVATVYGNTNVNIYGGTFDNTGIYGGGAGVDAVGTVGTDTEFLNIAKVYGTTNVTIDPRMPGDFETKNPSWTYTGNIYGGGALGSVEGNTNVKILGGIINGNVFGAGQGEEGHPNKAKVTGTTNVTVGE